jgi:hypothetical protein
MVLALAGIAGILMLKNAANKAQANLVGQECGNQLVRLSFASMMWLQQIETQNYPKEFSQMFDIMGSPKSLFCPGDGSRTMIRDWAVFEDGMSTYEIISPGVSFLETNAVFVRCPIHGHVIRADGFVYDKAGERFKKGVW